MHAVRLTDVIIIYVAACNVIHTTEAITTMNNM